MSDSPLYDELMDTIRAEFPGVTHEIDRHKTSRYVMLKVNGKTAGYVNGRHQYRVHAPSSARTEEGWPSVLICNPAQIPVAIEFLQQYVKEAAT